MSQCNHKKTRCLNHYDTFRKYLCTKCNKVFICKCDKEMVSTLFPHQKESGQEYGTQKEFVVDGFAKVCAKCNGKKEDSHPRAQIYGLKKKLDRYYWREIDFYYYKKILNYLKENKLIVKDIFEFEKRFPEKYKEYKKEAREYWKQEHKKNPLYEYNEINQDDFLKKINIPVVEIEGKKIIKKNRSYWITSEGEEVSTEKFVADYYKTQGYTVYYCERRIISTLIGTFLWTPINEPDENLQICGIGSRGKLSKTSDNDFDKQGILWMNLPKDFGSNQFFNRKKKEFIEWLNLLKKCGKLIEQYDYFLEASQHLRDYLWVNNYESEDITRSFLTVVPDEITFRIIEWGIDYFWDKQTGWPDLFIVKDKKFFFVEVKGPNDKLSPDQMNWFEWIIKNKIFECYICKVKKIKK